MNLLFGVGMLAAASVLFAWIYGKTRIPVPAAWTRRDIVMVPIILVFTASLSVGVGFLAIGLYHISDEITELGLRGTGLVFLIAGGGIWLTLRLSKNFRRVLHADRLTASVGEVNPAKAA